MSRNAKLVVVALAVLGIGIALFTSLTVGSSDSKLDAGLKQSATQLQTMIKQPDVSYDPANSSFLNLFNLFQANERAALKASAPRTLQPGQFAQLTIWETQTMPPVWQNLTQPGKPLMQLDGNLINNVAGGKTVATTVHQGNLEFRVYLMPLAIPTGLASQETHGVLGVYQAIQG